MSERETRADAEHWQAALRLYEALLDLPAEARAEALSRADAAPEARGRRTAVPACSTARCRGSCCPARWLRSRATR